MPLILREPSCSEITDQYFLKPLRKREVTLLEFSKDTIIGLSDLTRRHFKPILVKAGLSEKIRLYDLRHTCATLLLLSQTSPKVVAERLGHSTVVLTLDTYSNVLPSMQKKATNKLERLLFVRNK